MVSVREQLSETIINSLSTNSTFHVSGDSARMNFAKMKSSDFSGEVQLSYGQISFPPICKMNINLNGISSTAGMTTSRNSTCHDVVLVQKAIEYEMAVTGTNGDNEAFITSSKTIGLSFSDEENNNIPVNGLSGPDRIQFSIKRNVTASMYQLVDVSFHNLSASSASGEQEYFLQNGFLVNASNATILINLKPDNVSAAYLILIEFGQNPYLNQSHKLFDHWKLFCPAGKSNQLLSPSDTSKQLSNSCCVPSFDL